MNPRVKEVIPTDEYTLKLTFKNNEQDICPDTLYLDSKHLN